MLFLRARGKDIVDELGRPIKLRGVNIGAWMNLENFLNGYPSSESALRAEFDRQLGEERAAYFFERLLSYMFSEQDAEFLGEQGFNVVRIPLNYHHFERDMEPFVYREEGFLMLDKAIEWCGKNGLYVILDMHTVPGSQGPDWHSDNSSQRSYFWDQRQFQDRYLALWQAIARRYKDNPTVAAYDVLNEPVSNSAHGRFPAEYESAWDKINEVYRSVVAAIREVDDRHMILLEGDYLGFYFSGFDEPFDDNLVYSSHLYPDPAIKEGTYPGAFEGRMWDKSTLRLAFLESEGALFASRHNVPLLVGEFGTLFIHPEEQVSRLSVMSDMLEAFEEFGAHWTVWTYKDVGNMGLLQIDPRSAYAALIAPLLDAEASFTRLSGEGKRLLAATADHIADSVGDPAIDRDLNRYLFEMSVKENYLHLVMLPSYVRSFKAMEPETIDDTLKAFSVHQCVKHPVLEAVTKWLPDK
ncbi:glycoside hydrolase family 5 protein [Paenibacillaceae bacterium WGS1546]|uniref:glycoside hydrolase family 5 protein n=1 Tax=Cohnella sp. WGS1546 TaxID=3366810 RepID=UPI00372D1FF6